MLLVAGCEQAAIDSPAPGASAEAPVVDTTPAVVAGDDEAVAESQLPKLLDLGAGKCIPCKMMAPILDELREKYEGQLEVVFIDVWQNPDEAEKYAVDQIPTQIFFDAAGKERFRHTGFYSKQEILAKWKELGVDLAP
jgi:thioredoxin 1